MTGKTQLEQTKRQTRKQRATRSKQQIANSAAAPSTRTGEHSRPLAYSHIYENNILFFKLILLVCFLWLCPRGSGEVMSGATEGCLRGNAQIIKSRKIQKTPNKLQRRTFARNTFRTLSSLAVRPASFFAAIHFSWTKQEKNKCRLG